MLSTAPLAYVVHTVPKTRRRGARVQHSSIHDPLTIELLRTTFGDDPPDTPLVTGSAAQFRRRFAWLLRSLGLPPASYTPGGLRGGGACHAFSLERDVSLLCWRMRISSQSTLSHYLQECSAAVGLQSISAESRRRVAAAATLLPTLVSGCASRR